MINCSNCGNQHEIKCPKCDFRFDITQILTLEKCPNCGFEITEDVLALLTK